jgi:hypothetical protein
VNEEFLDALYVKKGYCTDTQGVIAKRNYISLVRKKYTAS